MRAVLAGLAVGTVLLLGACAGGSDEDGPRPPDPSTPAPSTPAPSQDADDGEGGAAPEPGPEPTLTTKPSGQTVRLTGTVRVSTEDRCTLLTGAEPQTQGTSSWVLVGQIAGLADGQRLTLTGRIDPGATSRCQQGPVLVVTGVDDSTS